MDNRRLILIFVFCFSLVMLWDAWEKYTNPVVAGQATTAVESGSAVPVPSTSINAQADATASSGTPAPAAVPGTSGAEVAARGDIVRIKTDLIDVDISTVGGDLTGLRLNEYKSSIDKTEIFSLFGTKHDYLAQSGLIGDGLPNHKTLFTVLDGPRELAANEDTLQVRLQAPTVNGVQVTKIYTFSRGSYLINVEHVINNGGQNEVAAHAYFQLQRDTESPAGESRMVSTFTGPSIYTEQDKYQKISFDDIQNNKAKFNKAADNGWMAMVQHYFVSAWIPQEKVQREFYVRSLDGHVKPAVSAGIIIPLPVVASGASVTNSVSLFAGPQIQSKLDQLAKPVADGGIGAQGLPLVVDYGWLTIVAAPIFWCLEAIHKLVGNWGWSIVLLTICIKALFFPLSAASYKSMAKMKAIAPRMTALRERCGDDKQKLNAEMMSLYKTEKINPLGGCLPIVVQIPVFIALYWALLGAVEMRGAPWIGWITDLSVPDTLFGTIPWINFPIGPLPIIMMATMLIQTKLNPKPPDPMQARITMMMPFIFGFMFFSFPAGLVLYWVVNNTLSIAQQWQITRMIERGGKAANDAKA